MSSSTPMTMKALVTSQEQSASVQDVPVPQPGEGEILVKVHYVAQNPTDWKSMSFVKPGLTLGCDFAGTIQDANGFQQWHVGQRVAGFVQGATNRGAFAEYVVVEGSLIFAIPETVSFQQAVVTPLPFATAVQAMFQRLGLPEPTSDPEAGSDAAAARKWFLVYGAASSVGKYAVQLGKLAGLRVVATASEKNHELLKSLGADITVDYHETDWPEKVRSQTGDALTYAFDCISEKGSPQAIAKAVSSTKGGHIVTLLPVKHIRDSQEIENKKVRLESTIVYTVFERPLHYGSFDNHGSATPEDRKVWEKYLLLLSDWLASGKIKPNRIRERGGMTDILAGFQEQTEGQVSAEKLVYRIA